MLGEKMLGKKIGYTCHLRFNTPAGGGWPGSGLFHLTFRKKRLQLCLETPFLSAARKEGALTVSI